MKSSTADIPASIRCIVVSHADSLPDWWTIERAEHDGRRYEMPTKSKWGKGSAYVVSARLGEFNEDSNLNNNSDIEGSSWEMLKIAEAIENKSSFGSTRCSAETVENGVYLESPRNSCYPVLITHRCAQELAADIRTKVKPK